MASRRPGGTLRFELFGPGTSCRTEVAAFGPGIAVFRIVGPGIYNLDVHGSATGRIGGDHRFVGAPPQGYEMIYRASWGPLGDAQRREIAARKPIEADRAVACPIRRAGGAAPGPAVGSAKPLGPIGSS